MGQGKRAFPLGLFDELCCIWVEVERVFPLGLIDELHYRVRVKEHLHMDCLMS